MTKEDQPIPDDEMRDFLYFTKVFWRELVPLTQETWQNREYGTAAAGAVTTLFFVGGSLVFDLSATPFRAAYLGFGKFVEAGNKIGRRRKDR